ncbi:YbaB/EbfC family nucleoid-associated protein [Kineosporia sp. A_224]|uniref:YbaB/EbfC family nucleoid-associated protein n=1 Tax=Kineosporia sp. A_224 TaxID=1962180 RepID=UPI000B4A8E41|nr:YbaB/EbfC family nucleoid-associated protein [Kineosporia sp. A_224]
MDGDLDRRLAAMVQRAQVQAQQIQDVQREIGVATVTGQAGNGMVSVTVRGTGQITDISIDPDAVRYYDAGTLGAVVLEAVNDGVRRAVTLARDRYAEVMPDTGPFDQVLSQLDEGAQRERPTYDPGADYGSW